jgi:hypothetical protein
MEPDWFLEEVKQRTKFCDFVPLVTTATDGDNGGWFRNTTAGANFWSALYQPVLDRIRSGDDRLRPTSIADYLRRHGAAGKVRVHRGAWNTGDHSGYEFTQWTGSLAQRDALERVGQVSARLSELGAWSPDDADRHEQSLWRLLRAETSCNFFWGEAWVDRCHRDLDAAVAHLG